MPSYPWPNRDCPLLDRSAGTESPADYPRSRRGFAGASEPVKKVERTMVKNTISDEFDPIVDHEPCKGIAPDKERELPTNRSHEDAENRDERRH